MEYAMKLLVIEDDAQACTALKDCCENYPDMRIVMTTDDTSEAINAVTDLLPDAVILDLELHKGCGDGIQFLNMLRSLKSKPFILVTTNNISEIIHATTRQLGADFVMVKSQPGYSAKSVLDFLQSIRAPILEARNQKETQEMIDPDLSLQQKKARLKARIAAELDLIHISPRATGRRYLIDGIVLIMEGTERNIPDQLATTYRKSRESVERAMQNAIVSAWKIGHNDALEKYYTARINPIRGNPTVTELLHFYASKLQLEYGAYAPYQYVWL